MSAAKKEKLRAGTFKHIESELFAYWDTVKEIARLQEEIIHATPDIKNIGGGRSNLPGDPTGTTVVALVSHRRLEQLEKIVDAIQTVYERLPEDKKKLIRLKYWTHPQTLTWDGIARQVPISKRMALYWRDEIVLEIAHRLGWR